MNTRRSWSALLLSMCLALSGIADVHAQQMVWSEDFSNGCTGNCIADTYNGWRIVDNSDGVSGNQPNNWFVSCAEEGMAAASCGSACIDGDASLHIGSNAKAGGDMGATYDDTSADNATYRLAVSPVISTVGHSSSYMRLEFNFIAFGSSACTDDRAQLRLSIDGGATWPAVYQYCLASVCCGACNGYSSGQWTRYGLSLPAEFNNNPNVRIGFHWRNNGNAVGTDPSVAIDDIVFFDAQDADGDLLPDKTDNCPTVWNVNQVNSDGDRHGDPCDNCRFDSNEDQANNDGDSEGDVCDVDDDNDKVIDTLDNCPFDANEDQANNDGDGEGDSCDVDDDNDKVFDAADNCPLISNADQANKDDDAAGDACDVCPADPLDLCPAVFDVFKNGFESS